MIREPAQPSSSRDARPAFTFVEALIVVVVLGVVGSLALSIARQTQSAQLRAAAERFAADVAFAQCESIAHGDDPRAIVFDLPSGYHLAATSDTATPLTNPLGKLPHSVTFGQGRTTAGQSVTVVTASVGADCTLGFDRHGKLDQAIPAVVTFASDDRTLSVTIDPVSGEATFGPIAAK